jgi:diaminopimelate decarboxylase
MKKTYEKPVIVKITEGVPSKFGKRDYIVTIDEIDGVKVKDLIQKYGSPLYVISEKTLRERYKKLHKAFSVRYPKFQLAWSYKTNYLDAVCKVFHSEGSWAEVVSGFEYEKAISNGVPGDKIIFNGPYKLKEDLIKAIKNGSFIHIDHFDELYDIISLADDLEQKPKVAIRVNMDTGIFPQWDRFGFNYDNGEAWKALTKIMVSKKMDLVGLHAHIGTYMMSAEPYRVAAQKLADLAQRLKDNYGHTIDYIDLGGGFASDNTLKGAYLPGKDTNPSFDEYAEAITDALISAGFDIENLPTLILETGRALVDDAGYIVGTVWANKRLADGRRALILDVGVNLLFTSFWYEHEIYPAVNTGKALEDITIYGPLCMNIDVIRNNIKFPPLNRGDNVVIKRIGAYNMTQWLQFITYRPNVVMIDMEGKDHIIRKKENLSAFKSF